MWLRSANGELESGIAGFRLVVCTLVDLLSLGSMTETPCLGLCGAARVSGRTCVRELDRGEYGLRAGL
jgi:hypothetical protein